MGSIIMVKVIQGHLNIKIKSMVFSEITVPEKVNFYVEPLCLGGGVVKILCAKSGSNAEHGCNAQK